MPRYYCDYCNAYLTHDSPSVRKQHNAGYKHKANVRQYYQQFEEQHTQSLIDQRIREHHGQTAAADAAFSRYQMGAAPFNQYARLPTFPIHPPPQPTALYNPALRSNAFIHPPGYGVCPLLSPGASVHSHPTDGVPGIGLHSALTCAAYSSPRMPATTTIYNEYNLVPQQPNEYNVYESLGKHDSSVSQDLWVSPPGCE